jgi:hypothetical protein
MVRAKQKMYPYRRWLCEEILRNKFFSNYNHSWFIHIVSFELNSPRTRICDFWQKHYRIFSSWSSIELNTTKKQSRIYNHNNAEMRWFGEIC